MISRALAVWFAFMVLAILNGVARNALLTPRVGEQSAHVASTITLCAAILALTWLAIPWIGTSTTGAAIGVGALWLSLTVAFEFLAGHFAFGHSWEKLLADYDLSRGRVWVLVLIATAAAPVLAHRLRRTSRGR